MASASSSSPFGNRLSSSGPTRSAASTSTTTSGKKKRNLPGNPSPDAEVIALSPKTLMATNRFVCDVCNKGFQREQNLQLHRRGHNLPWKLRQKGPNEVRKRVYLCPEPTCVHHDPSRALGDLTGIKKHFSRKHGEKKWKCDRCSKIYAVHSDLKAHSKTCGTREYRCECGTLFSRRDSFTTHRAFCDALARETSRLPMQLDTIGSHLYGNTTMALGLSQINPQMPSLHDQIHHSFLQNKPFDHSPISTSNPLSFYLGSANQDFGEDTQSHHSLNRNKPFDGLMQLPDNLQSTANTTSSSVTGTNLLNFSFLPTTSVTNNQSNGSIHDRRTERMNSVSRNPMIDGIAIGASSLYETSTQNDFMLPQLSATALLQKATEMGAMMSNGPSLLGEFGNSSLNFGGGNVGESLRSQIEHETHLQDLMNSLANGNSAGFDESGRIPMLDGREQDHGFEGLIGSSDGLTRDFLGVGSMMRSMGGGISQNDEPHDDIGIGFLDSEIESTPSSRSFPGGNLQLE